MTFTGATIRKLRALNLPQETFDAVLEIFESARESKKKGSAGDRVARGTRLAEDWVLPKAWGDWGLSAGLRRDEVLREATKFKNYWLNATGVKGIKLRWDLTWQNWCMSALERLGRSPVKPHYAAGGAEQKDYSEETWEAIARRYKTTGNWNPAWGPAPNEVGCMMPDKFKGRYVSVDYEMGP